MRQILWLAICIALSGCGQTLYDGYALGRCKQDNASQHTEHDLGGIAWCVPGAGSSRQTRWLD